MDGITIAYTLPAVCMRFICALAALCGSGGIFYRLRLPAVCMRFICALAALFVW